MTAFAALQPTKWAKYPAYCPPFDKFWGGFDKHFPSKLLDFSQLNTQNGYS